MLNLPTADERTEIRRGRRTDRQTEIQSYSHTDRRTDIQKYLHLYWISCKHAKNCRRQNETNSAKWIVWVVWVVWVVSSGLSTSASECELTEWYAYDLYIHYSIYIYTHIAFASTSMWKSIAIFIFREFFPLHFFCETSWQGRRPRRGGVAKGVRGGERVLPSFGALFDAFADTDSN